MRLPIITMKAKDVKPDNFIYIPSEKRFFWIDDIDYEEKDVIFYFEESIDKTRGLVSSTLSYDKNDNIYVVENDN